MIIYWQTIDKKTSMRVNRMNVRISVKNNWAIASGKEKRGKLLRTIKELLKN